jgi:hypothetical protein
MGKSSLPKNEESLQNYDYYASIIRTLTIRLLKACTHFQMPDSINPKVFMDPFILIFDEAPPAEDSVRTFMHSARKGFAEKLEEVAEKFLEMHKNSSKLHMASSCLEWELLVDFKEAFLRQMAWSMIQDLSFRQVERLLRNIFTQYIPEARETSNSPRMRILKEIVSAFYGYDLTEDDITAICDRPVVQVI